MLENRGEVLGEGVVVVADGGLARLAKAAAVIGDDAVASGEEFACLALPRSSVERVAVDEHDRPAGPVVVEVDPDVGAVLFPDGDEGHGGPLTQMWVSPTPPLFPRAHPRSTNPR